MIKRFSTLYVGHIELEACGHAGTAADARRYPNDRLAETFETTRQLAVQADRLGYATLWLAEHHFQHEGYECIPNIPLLAVDLAHRTKRVNIGCAFNVVPTWHPLRLAEDFATADILTGGRVIFGVGRGYHTREVETFGNPMLDADANRELFEEQVEIMLKAFREESFSHHGKHYTIPPEVPYRGYTLKEITLVPRPLRQPVDVWQPLVSGSERGLDFMARNGIKGVVSGTAEELTQRWFGQYRDAARRHGRELALGQDLMLGFRMCIDDSVEAAMAKARPYFEEHSKVMAPLGMLRYSEEHVRAVAARQAQSPTAASLENGVRNRSWLCGPGRDIVAYLKDVEARYPGLEEIMFAFAIGTPRALMLEQLDRFAREVMPAFVPPA
jgi:alkanesulfonate monooxygenase SsuD/methylene tetrahydromethanopterin reductase-like flavin-dependent oxidoreductase (luciferase family)